MNTPWVEMNTHTLTTTTTGSKCSQNEVNNQTDYQRHIALGPPKGPFFTDTWSQLRPSTRHTLRNQQAQVKQPETC